MSSDPAKSCSQPLVKSEGRGLYVEEGRSNSMKETCALHCNKETCANNLSNPHRDSLFRKTVIPTNERKLIVIDANRSHSRYKSPRWLQRWCVITIKTNENKTDHITGTPWNRCCSRRLREMEQKHSQTTVGFIWFMKPTVREELNTVWNTRVPCATFEQRKDTLVAFRQCKNWWDTRLFLMTGKSISFTEVVHGIYNVSWGVDWFRVESKTTKLDKQSSSHLWILSVKIQTKKNPMIITRFLRKCSITVIGKAIKMPSIG